LADMLGNNRYCVVDIVEIL